MNDNINSPINNLSLPGRILPLISIERKTGSSKIEDHISLSDVITELSPKINLNDSIYIKYKSDQIIHSTLFNSYDKTLHDRYKTNILICDTTMIKTNPTCIVSPNIPLIIEPHVYVFTTMYKYMLKRNENIYDRYFSKKHHLIFLGRSFGNYSFFILAKKSPTLFGYIIDPKLFTEFVIGEEIHNRKIITHLSQIFTTFDQIRPLKVTQSLIEQLISFEIKFSHAINVIHIGIIFASANQHDPFDMLANRTRHASDNFNKFLSIMRVSDFNADNIFDDIFFGIKLKYYLSTTMSYDEIRQHIGNLQCIIIFKDHNTPLPIDKLVSLGKMNQFFFIIEQASDWYDFSSHPNPEQSDIFDEKIRTSPNLIKSDVLYRIDFIKKIINTFDPIIPTNALFGKNDIRKFILTKFYHGLTILKVNSDISNLFIYPRTVALNDMAKKLISKN